MHYTGIFTYQFIVYHASVHTHTHNRTLILCNSVERQHSHLASEGRELTGLKVDTANSSTANPHCTDQCELPQQLVVAGHLALSLVHFDLHLGLAVGGCGEDLGLLGGDGSVAVDEFGEHPS